MTIFGDGRSTNNTLIHHGTTMDFALNYVFGAILLGALPIGLFLNPLMLFYNYKIYKRQPSIVPALFQLLSILDFLYTLRTIDIIYNLMKPTQDPLFDMDPSPYQRWISFTTYVDAYSSMFVTMVMCGVRYVKIRAPFWSMANDTLLAVLVVVVILVDLAWSTTVSAMSSLVRGTIWFSPLQGIMVTVDENVDRRQLCDQFYMNIMAPFYLKVGLSILFSVLTIYELRSESGQKMPEIKRRSIKMIVILNAGNVFWFSFCVASNAITEAKNYTFGLDPQTNWSYWYFYVSFWSAIMAPALLAAYNPLVFCTRNTGIRSAIQRFIATGRIEIETDSITRTPVHINRNTEGGFTGSNMKCNTGRSMKSGRDGVDTGQGNNRRGYNTM